MRRNPVAELDVSPQAASAVLARPRFWRAPRIFAALAAAALVVVPRSSGAREEALQDTPQATDVVTAEMIESLPDRRSVVESLAGVYSICPPVRGIDAGLSVPSRTSFYMPGVSVDEVERIEILRGPGSAVYGAGGGAVVSIVTRNDEAFKAALAQLEAQGKIQDLEMDPCREYFPEPGGAGCPPDENIMDLIVLALEKEYGGTTGGAGAVQVGPLPPSPVYDPGPRPGDEKGPTFVRTGADGSFTLPVGDLGGLVQVEAAAGCESKTTVARAGGEAGGGVRTATGEPPPTTQARDARPGGSGTTTRGGGTVPPEKTPASTPKEPPPEGLKLCGPDVTDYVLGVMDFMNETYNQWSVSEQNERCKSLFGWRANGAWELALFSPYDQPQKGDPQTMGAYFFQRFTTNCARPEPCQSSVEFLGHCMPAQVVNYIQWGGVNALCDTETLGSLSHIARDTAIQLIWNQSLSAGYAFRGQSAMTHLGKEFIKDSRGLGQKKKHLKGLLDQYFKSFPSEMGFGLEACACQCGEYETPGFENMGWGFKWGGDGAFIERRGKELRKP